MWVCLWAGVGGCVGVLNIINSVRAHVIGLSVCVSTGGLVRVGLGVVLWLVLSSIMGLLLHRAA